ncbi:MAG: SGNH/GDSL hydrolase family protein [Bacteroidota bacterium]
MRYLSVFLLVTLFFTFTDTARGQKKLVIIGSSTSACFNVNSVTECYVGRLSSYYNQEPPFDTLIDNHLALGGSNCYNGMPTSYTSPYDNPYKRDEARNITMALSLNPDVIIVNYPTNGYDVLRVDSILYCLRTIRDSANEKGVPCFITTTQPRTSPASFNTGPVKAKLAELKDSILLEFGNFAIDFWTGLINPADTTILYDSGDQIHMNGTGHDILFQRVLAKNIFMATLPTTFLQFNTVHKNNTNIVSWSTARETDVAYFEIQRSGDGTGFSRIGTIAAGNGYGNNEYQYTDLQPLQGRNFYKILVLDKDGKKQVSPVMSVNTGTGKFGLLKAYARTNAQVVIELENNESGNASWELLTNTGMVISRQTGKIVSGSTTLYLNTPPLSNGIYHVRVVTGKASVTTSFIKN